MKKLESLHKLVSSLFTVEELLMLVKFDEHLSQVHDSLPIGKPKRDVVYSFVLALQRMGLIDKRFFMSLVIKRPNRAKDIVAVLNEWSSSKEYTSTSGDIDCDEANTFIKVNALAPRKLLNIMKRVATDNEREFEFLSNKNLSDRSVVNVVFPCDVRGGELILSPVLLKEVDSFLKEYPVPTVCVVPKVDPFEHSMQEISYLRELRDSDIVVEFLVQETVSSAVRIIDEVINKIIQDEDGNSSDNIQTNHSPPVKLQVLWNKSRYQLEREPCVGLVSISVDESAIDFDAGSERVSVHHIFVLDLSGSMNKGGKLPVLMSAVQGYLSSISDDDLLSIITFSSVSESLITSKRMADISKDPIVTIASLIQNWRHKFHCTYMGGALNLAQRSIRIAADEHGFVGVNRLNVLTDGILDDYSPCLFAFQDIARDEHTVVNYFGFGTGFDAEQAGGLLEFNKRSVVRYVSAKDTEIVDSFAHMARTSQRIIFTNAKIVIHLSDNITCFDVFLCRPHEKYIGNYSEYTEGKIEFLIGAIEYRKQYILLVKLRSWDPANTCLGRAILQAEIQGGVIEVEQELQVQVGDSFDNNEYVVAMEQSVAHLVADDRATIIQSLRARIRLFERENRPQVYIDALSKKLRSLESSENEIKLSDDEERYVRSAVETCTALLPLNNLQTLNGGDND